MKSLGALLLVLLLFVSVSSVQNASAQAARTDVYHVHLAKAALGNVRVAVDEPRRRCQPMQVDDRRMRSHKPANVAG